MAEKKAWEINSKVREILTRNWLDTQRIMINTVKDTVFIKGKMLFLGDKVDTSIDVIVINVLKKLDREIFAIQGVKHVKWKMSGWRREHGGKWSRQKEV